MNSSSLEEKKIAQSMAFLGSNTDSVYVALLNTKLKYEEKKTLKNGQIQIDLAYENALLQFSIKGKELRFACLKKCITFLVGHSPYARYRFNGFKDLPKDPRERRLIKAIQDCGINERVLGVISEMNVRMIKDEHDLGNYNYLTFYLNGRLEPV